MSKESIWKSNQSSDSNFDESRSAYNEIPVRNCLSDEDNWRSASHPAGCRDCCGWIEPVHDDTLKMVKSYKIKTRKMPFIFFFNFKMINTKVPNAYYLDSSSRSAQRCENCSAKRSRSERDPTGTERRCR